MKRFLAGFLATLMLLNLAACGGSASSSSSPAPSSSAQVTSSSSGSVPADTSPEPVTIKFANYALLESGYTEFWENVKTGFEVKYPHITIEWVTAPYGEVLQQVINMAGGGDKVDLVLGEINWVPTMEDAGLTVPVDTIMTKEFLDDFYPNIIDAHSINGKMYGVPLFVSLYVLYYNKDVFTKAGLDPEKPPKTYDEMLEMAAKIAPLKTDDGNKIYPFGQATASVPVSGSALTAMVYNFGGRVLSDDGKLASDMEGFKQAFEMLKTLEQKGYNPQNAKLKDLRNLFALGQLGMYYDQSAGFNGVQAINPDAKDFTASAAPLAGGSGNGASVLQSQCFLMADNGESQREAVRLFVEYVITPEILVDYMVNLSPSYPAKKSMAGMTEITNSSILKGAANAITLALPPPLTPAMADINLELCTLAQAITISGEDVDSAIAAFNKAASALLE